MVGVRDFADLRAKNLLEFRDHQQNHTLFPTLFSPLFLSCHFHPSYRTLFRLFGSFAQLLPLSYFIFWGLSYSYIVNSAVNFFFILKKSRL